MSEKVIQNKSYRQIVGLVPAAGRASRISPLPCSKELLPVSFQRTDNGNGVSPKVISQYILEAMGSAHIKNVYIILRHGKWDIPSYYGDGKMLNMHFAYLMMDVPYGVPYSLDQAFPFIERDMVVLGFPDMMIQPRNAFASLLERQSESHADIVLGLFPAHQPHKTDMVDIDNDGNVKSISIKPAQTILSYAWEIAVWTPKFSKFMHEYLSTMNNLHDSFKNNPRIDEQNELHIGDVIQAAIDDNMHVDSVLFKDGDCLDIGTPESLLKAVQLKNTDY